MSNRYFRTTINCANCIRAITPGLDQAVGAGNWQVDTSSPDKILTIKADAPTAHVIRAVEVAGFHLEQLLPLIS